MSVCALDKSTYARLLGRLCRESQPERPATDPLDYLDERNPVLTKPIPCKAPPGTEEKIRALAARIVARQELWHPADAPLTPDATIQAEYERRKNGSDVIIGLRISAR